MAIGTQLPPQSSGSGTWSTTLYKMQQFRAALPSELCYVVAQRDNATIDEMYVIVTTRIEREKENNTCLKWTMRTLTLRRMKSVCSSIAKTGRKQSHEATIRPGQHKTKILLDKDRMRITMASSALLQNPRLQARRVQEENQRQ
jgi:hypothetical protein